MEICVRAATCWKFSFCIDLFRRLLPFLAMTSTMRPQHNRNARARCEVVVAICASITNFNLYSAAGTCVEDERRGEFMVYESRSRMTSRKESRCSGSPECSSFLVANESAQTALHYFLGNNTEILQCAIARSDCERRKKKLENSWEWTVSMRSCFIELYQNRKALSKYRSINIAWGVNVTVWYSFTSL